MLCYKLRESHPAFPCGTSPLSLPAISLVILNLFQDPSGSRHGSRRLAQPGGMPYFKLSHSALRPQHPKPGPSSQRRLGPQADTLRTTAFIPPFILDTAPLNA